MTNEPSQGHTPIPSKPTEYRSFLLRLWAVSPDEPRVWRFSLEDPHTGERRGFANWERLQEFLKEVMNRTKSNDSIR